MKSLRRQIFQNHELSIGAYSDTSGKSCKVYLKPRDIPLREAARILNRLNSFNSAEQLNSTVQNRTKQMILSTGDARRILHSKEELGEFKDLQQVAVIQRIGAKKFNLIVRALSD
jgi:hypothetical protein